MNQTDAIKNLDCIAIIGMAVRMPGALNIEAFWENLSKGKESISLFTKEEMLAAGLDPKIVNHPNFVAAKGIMDEAEMFDANFFGISPREAELMDPQHRVLMECAWSAMEDAGYVAEQYPGRISILTSAGMNTYLPFNLMSNPELLEKVGGFELSIYNDKDFVPTRIAYSMNIHGPAIDIGTACSSSLVSTHLACQQLLTYQADMTVVGGITIHLPQKMGHIHEPGAAYSPDNHCRPFDATPSGLIDGNGAAVIILKRLEDALQDGDKIHALIKGSAINNDGSEKVGYSAPSINGQADVILEAQAVADVDPSTISYIEAHGTSTPLGDPIEVAGLTQAFRVHTDKRGFCGLGSVKSNIGHVDKAAGLAGLIKTTLALEHELLPPSLNWTAPNPKLEIEKTPFYIVDKPTPWKRSHQPRRAGVSSFGVGGTNAHAILEEPPQLESQPSKRNRQIITLSAKTKQALEDSIKNLSNHFLKNPNISLADVANTLQRGRKNFSHKIAFSCTSISEATSLLSSAKSTESKTTPQPVFMFTGQGSQYAGMGESLYEDEKVFKDAIDSCSEILKPLLKIDIREILFPSESMRESANLRLQETSLTQPCLFTLEYALAKLWMHLGITPKAMIGHSLGEYVAACIAEVFTLEEALKLVVKRSQLMQKMSSGSMLSVPLSADAIIQDLDRLQMSLDIAANNAPELCVVSGPSDLIGQYQAELEKKGISSQILKTSHAYHSAMMEPMLEAFHQTLSEVQWQIPSIPFISNKTGTWIHQNEVNSPRYWCDHLRQTVMYGQGIQRLNTDIESPLFIEIGPGKTLSQLTQLNLSSTTNNIISSLPQAFEKKSAADYFIDSLLKVWLNNGSIDWNAYYENEARLKVSLPTYPFERTRYWIEQRIASDNQKSEVSLLNTRQTNPDYWFYINSWKSSPTFSYSPKSGESYLLMGPAEPLTERIKNTLVADGNTVINIYSGSDYKAEKNDTYYVNFSQQNQLALLKKALTEHHTLNAHILLIGAKHTQGFNNAIALLNILKVFNESLSIKIIDSNVINFDSPKNEPCLKSSILGIITTNRFEQPLLPCSLLDIQQNSGNQDHFNQHLLGWIYSDQTPVCCAIRNADIWTPSIEPLAIQQYISTNPLKDGDTYLILGGLDGIGYAFSQAIAQSVNCNLILSSANPDYLNDRQIQSNIKKLQDLGSNIIPVHVDPSNIDAPIDQLPAFPGPIKGVINSLDMNVNQLNSLILDTDSALLESQLQDQQTQLEKFAHFIKPLKAQFCVMMSSLSSKIGGLGSTVHACRGNLINAFAGMQTVYSETPWTVINWDRWDESSDREGFSPEEGMLAFTKALSLLHVPNFIVATSNPNARLNSSKGGQSQTIQDQTEETAYERPDLGNEFIAPSSKTEIELAQLWQACLKIKEIGVLDNFFDLGGHSLLAAQLIRQIKQEFAIHLDLALFFSAPTISELASLIDQQSGQKNNLNIEEEIKQIENMTDEEVEALLAGDHTPEELIQILGKSVD